MVTIHPKIFKPERAQVIPKWIAKHAFFPGEFYATLTDNPLGALPGGNLSHLKEVLHIAAISVKKVVSEKLAETLDEKLHWALSFVRAIRAFDIPRMQLAIARFGGLASTLTDPPHLLTADPLRGHRIVEDLSRQIAERELTAAHHTDSDKSRCDILQRQAAAWRKAGRRLFLNAIRDHEGNIIPDPEEAAILLQKYWQDTFRERSIDEALADQAIALTTPFNPNHDWNIKQDTFDYIIAAGKNSAPGPDGIPYAAYKAIKDVAAPSSSRHSSAISTATSCPRTSTPHTWLSSRKARRPSLTRMVLPRGPQRTPGLSR